MTLRFRTLLPLLILLAAGLSVASAQNPGDALFAGTQVHTVNIRFLCPDYWDSLTVYYNAGFEQYIPATVIFDGRQYDSVGVRFKGNSSFTHPNNKKSLRLAFDEFKDLKIDGEKGLHLNNVWGDPTFLREKIFLDYCRDAGIAAPRANYARVSLNDTLWGFYTLIEHVDKRFLSNHYGKNSGDLFKAVDAFGPVDTSKIISDFKWIDGNADSYAQYYELKTDGSATAWPQLLSILDSLNHGQALDTWMPTKINMPALCNAIAANMLFANLDSYTGSGRNFYFYFNPTTSKMEWITWDVGLSFGVFPLNVSNMEGLSLLHVQNADDRPLWKAIISTPLLRTQYLQAACSQLQSHFITDRLYAHIDSVAAVIRPLVLEDPRKMYTYQQFETNIETEITADGGGGKRKPGLKSFILQRSANVLTQLQNLGIDCQTAVEPGAAAQTMILEQNHPNPFNPSTTITFQLPARQHVRLEVFSVLGARVALIIDGVQEVGTHTLLFNAAELPGGVYICRLSAGTQTLTRRMTLLK